MRSKYFLLLMTSIIVLAACSSSDDYDPAAAPTKITLSLVSSEGTNPNIDGDATPIEVQVFELTDDSMFLSADYDQMKGDYEDALGSNYVENYDYVMAPDQFKYVNAFEIDEDTSYIGVVAHFSEPELSEWKKVVKVLNIGHEYHLLMYFKDYEVKLEKVE